MSDGLANPLALFDIAGKVALVTGASGAYGALAARILAGAGCKLVLSAGKAAELAAVAGQCRDASRILKHAFNEAVAAEFER